MADSVFYELGDTPEEAANLTARGMLMIAIEQRIREEGWTQTEAAARLHLTQPRVSDLLNGKINKFSLDALVNMLPPVGLAIDVRHAERSPSRAAKAKKGRSVAADRSTEATAHTRKSLSAH
jgi:predicted XRE-type DNA-binding protein